MRKKYKVSVGCAGAIVAVILASGCAGKPAQGYGVSKSTASEAHAQLMAAEQSTQVDTESTYLGLIEQMQQAGHWYAALAHTEAFEREHGTSARIQLLRADALRNTLQLDAAKRLYTSLFSTPQASRAHRGIGLLEASQGRYEEAIVSLEKARALNPIDANILSDLGYAYMRSGRLLQAQLPVMQAAQLAPNSSRIQLNLALYWLASGEEALGGQVIQKLQHPQAKGGRALIGQDAVQSLQEQLAIIKNAMAARQEKPSQGLLNSTEAPVVRVSAVALQVDSRSSAGIERMDKPAKDE